MISIFEKAPFLKIIFENQVTKILAVILGGGLKAKANVFSHLIVCKIDEKRLKMFSSKRFLKKILCIITLISLFITSSLSLTATAADAQKRGIGGGTGTGVGSIAFTFNVKYVDDTNAELDPSLNYQDTRTGYGSITPEVKNIQNYHFAGYYYYDDNLSNVQGSLSHLLTQSPPSVETLADGSDAIVGGTSTYHVYMVYTYAPVYTLQYHLNGGSGTLPNAASYLEGAAVSISDGSALSRADYLFTGWNTQANGSGDSYSAAASISMPPQNLTLFAQWKTNITVTYHPNGGAGNTYANTVSQTSYTVLDNNNQNLRFTKEGYHLIGWDTNKNAGTAAYTSGEAITLAGSMTLYAIWEKTTIPPPSLTVTYHPNGGTGSAYSESTSASEYTLLNNKNIFLRYERENYYFAGWSTDKNAVSPEYSGGDKVTLVSNLTLYAVWTPDDEPMTPHQHYSYVIGYPDGSIKPERYISREEISAILIRILDESTLKSNWKITNTFTDVAAKRWSSNSISTLENLKYIVGYPDHTFHPDNYITREEFATIIVRIAGLENATPKENYFTDTKGWATKYVNLAFENRLVFGYDNTTFRPKANISRAEAISIINRVLDRNVLSKNDLLPGMITFTDNLNTNAWYYSEIQEATNSHFCVPGVEKDGIQYEKWTQFSGTPDWIALTKQGVNISNFVYPKE